MKKLIMIILLAWVAIAVHAQQYFNVRDPLHSTTSILTSAVEVNGKYYCTGTCVDSVNRQPDGSWIMKSGVKFAVYDFMGSKLIDTVYQAPYRNIDPWRNTLFHLGNSEFLLAAECVDSGGANRMIFFKFDSVGNVLWQKTFNKPVCTERDFYKLRDLRQDPITRSWLMLSTVSCALGNRVQADFLLTKLDSSFNEIWHKQYGHATLNDIPSKILVEPDGYILAGGRHNTNWVSMGFAFQAEIIKTDTTGNVQWTYYSPQNKLTNVIQDIIKTQDGGYVYCGQGDGWERVFPNGVNADIFWKGWIEKLDANRIVVWSKVIHNDSSNWESNNQSTLNELPNGAIVVAGSLWQKINSSDTQTYHFGALTKFDPSGNEIWQRAYRHNSDTLIYQVYGMKITNDGGFVMYGEARDDYAPYMYPRQQGWLVKVDSNGCTNPQCLFTIIPEEPKTYNSITIYPNPANDVLKVRCTKPLRSIALSLYDVTGRLIKSQDLNHGITEISVQDLPIGVYVYKVRSDGKVVAQGKIVKE